MNTERTISWNAVPDFDKADLGLERMRCVNTRLYTGTLSPESGAFSLHPHIAFFNGILYAAWSVHYGDEDSPGQYVRYAFSTDLGESWSESRVLFEPMEHPLRNSDEKDADGNRIQGHRPHDACGSGNKSELPWLNDSCSYYHLMLCSNGFAVAGGELYAIAEAATVVNRGIGRLARRISADGKHGAVMWLNDDFPDIKTLNPHAINTELYNNSGFERKRVEEIIEYLRDSRHMPQWDMMYPGWRQYDGKTAGEWGSEFAKTHSGGCGEPTYSYVAADGAYMRLWRNNEGVQHTHFSLDRGLSWSEIINSSYPETGARTSVTNLPDGSVCLIGNPGVKRMQLCISVSRDGYGFTKNAVLRCEPPLMKHRGRAKGTGFHYPHCTVAGDYLFVVYSVNKEDIDVSKIRLEDLYIQ